jgi:hypothetical protein
MSQLRPECRALSPRFVGKSGPRSFLRKSVSAAFAAGKMGLVFVPDAWLAWEMAMSELKQQTIALWILLMLLLMVPWVLE